MIARLDVNNLLCWPGQVEYLKQSKFLNNYIQLVSINIKMSKMKERMRKKAEQNKNNGPTYSANYSENKSENKSENQEKNINQNPSNLNDLNSNLASLMEQMQNHLAM